MSLTEDLRKELAPVVQRCPVTFLMEQFNPQETEAFNSALQKIQAVPAQDRRSRSYPYTSAWLLGVLRSNGYTLSKESLRRHLMGGCNCESV